MAVSLETGCVSIIVVSHSAAIARGVAELVSEAGGLDVSVLAVGGGRHGSLGTDRDRVLAALRRSASMGSAVVLVDMGSSVLTVRAAFEQLTASERLRIHLVDAPLVEGAVAAAATASTGADLADVARAAEEARHVTKL